MTQDQAPRRETSHHSGHRRLQAWGRMAAAAALAFQSSSISAAGVPVRGSLPVASLKNVSYQDKTLRISLDRPVEYRIFSLDRPGRLVVELSHTIHGDKPFEVPVQDDGILKKIRFAQFQTSPDKVARVVLEMPRAVPFQTTQEGSDIVLSFGAKASATASMKESAPGVSISGEMEASLEASASATAGSSSKPRKHTRDLIATLPKNAVTIDFDDADVRDVIRVLSEMSGINIIHAGSVRGFVTVHLDQVPFNEAFETILSMQGLVAQQMGSNVLRILTPEELNADRARAVVTYKTFVLNYAKASELVPRLGLVKISPNSKAEVDERSNSIIVTDTPEGISAAERLISELDTRPQQVLIEAKVVEVSLNSSMDLGIQWEYANINNKANGYDRQIVGQRERKATTSVDPGKVGFGAVGTDAITGTPVALVESAFNAASRGTGVTLPNTSPQSAAFTFGFINNTDLLAATLYALSSEGKTKVLSSPRIITLNGQLAKIQVGSKLPFSTVTISPSGTSAQSITFVDVGVIMEVTPVINADNRVRLKLKPEVSIPGATVPGVGPQINTRNAETEVIIRDGETLVVGGLIDEQTRESMSKVPLLGDIPVLGVFFRNSFDQKNRTELLIFVTPRIVRD
jgi:type IV pilus assembly protein PilQ